MLRDEFGIKQLGKRLKILEAAKLQQAKAPKAKGKAKAAAKTPAPAPAPKANTGRILPQRERSAFTCQLLWLT